MSEPSDTAAKTTPGGSLSPDEADRIAARFRPVWELDEGQVEAGDAAALPPSSAELARGGLDSALEEALDPAAEAKLGAPSARSSTEAIDIRDTAVDGVPAVQIGASSPGRTSPDGTPPLVAASDEAKVAAAASEAAPPSARRKKVSATKIGLGADASDPAPPSASARPSQKGAAARTDPDRVSRAVESKGPRGETGAARASGPVSARAARAAIDDDPVELPVEQRSKLVGWIAIASAAAVVAIAGALWLSGGDDAPTSPTKATPTLGPVAELPAKPTAIATTEPALSSSAPLGAAPEPTASAEASAITAPATASASARASAEPTSAPKPSSQPVASTAQPKSTTAPATAKPPTTTKPPSGKPGGIIRDSPF